MQALPRIKSDTYIWNLILHDKFLIQYIFNYIFILCNSYPDEFKLSRCYNCELCSSNIYCIFIKHFCTLYVRMRMVYIYAHIYNKKYSVIFMFPSYFSCSIYLPLKVELAFNFPFKNCLHRTVQIFIRT